MDTGLLSARISDLVTRADRTGAPQFLGFVTPTEVALCDSVLKKERICYDFFGGHTDAERTMLCVHTAECENPVYPITPVSFTYSKNYSLAHRDFLGSVMALGIARECVGDILAGDGYAVMFLKKEIADFVVSQISKIGSVGVDVKKGVTSRLPDADTEKRFTSTVSSLRLDCVVSAVYSLSRNKSSELIEAGLVSLDGMAVTKLTAAVSSGQKLCLKGKGRVRIGSVTDKSRKGRIIIEYFKFM